MCRKYLPLQGTLIKEKALHQQVDRHVLKQNGLNKMFNEYAPVNIFNTENFINVAQLNFINVDDHTLFLVFWMMTTYYKVCMVQYGMYDTVVYCL